MEILLLVPFLWVLIIRHHWNILGALWKEPAIKHPVLIIESDDWGPGPPHTSGRLENIINLLKGFRDHENSTPKMSLGVILALPDHQKISGSGFKSYYRKTLKDKEYSKIREMMVMGAASGVFSLHLHGMEHFWPPSLLMALARDKTVKNWLKENSDPSYLPPHLQTRWSDTSTLPSKMLLSGEVEKEAASEVREFSNIFGFPPEAAVPPTFIWTQQVEKAWAGMGVEIIITPGHQNTGRKACGKPQKKAGSILNGSQSRFGQRYLVRDRYFEPSWGHTPAKAVLALRENLITGRPTLLETHAFNFNRDPASAEKSFKALELTLKMALNRFPKLRFISAKELVNLFLKKDPEMIITDKKKKLAIWLARAYRIPNLKKTAAITGLIIPALAIYAIASIQPNRRGGSRQL